jgi:hypothetical protein
MREGFNLEYKHLLRKAAKRTVEATWRQIGALLDAIPHAGGLKSSQ